MQLKRYTDYGIRTLMYLAIQPNREELFKIAEITETFELSSNHVSKIIHHLGKLGYIETIRGKHGGFKLAKSPKDINVGQLVRELENTLDPIDCKKPYCKFIPQCKLKGILADALVAYLAVLDSYCLDDVVMNKEQLLSTLPKQCVPLTDLL